MSATDLDRQATARIPTRSRQGFILGLSSMQLIAIVIGAALLAGPVMTGSLVGCVVALPFEAVIGWLAFTRHEGRPRVAWIPIYVQFRLRTRKKEMMFRRRPLTAPRPVGNLGLTGQGTPLRILEDPESNVALIEDPHQGSLTAILRVSHPGFALLDASTKDSKAASWSSLLASTARSGIIRRTGVLSRTVPDTGREIADYWEAHRPAGDVTGQHIRAYDALVRNAGQATTKHESYLFVQINLARAAAQIKAAGGGAGAKLAVARREMTSFAQSANDAGLRTGGWLTTPDLTALIRTAVDPSAGLQLDTTTIGREIASAGPMVFDESWDHVHTDSAFHQTLWVSEWPRVPVSAGFLDHMLSVGIRRTFTHIFEPLSQDAAFRQVREAKGTLRANARVKAKHDIIADGRDASEAEDIARQELELISGAAALRSAAFVTVSAPTLDQLTADVAALRAGATKAQLELRTMFGQQGEAFMASALPLGKGL